MKSLPKHIKRSGGWLVVTTVPHVKGKGSQIFNWFSELEKANEFYGQQD